MTTTRRKLLVVQSHPIQYFSPVYQALASDGRIDLCVAYLSDSGVKAQLDPGFARKVEWDVDLLGGHRHVIIAPGSSLQSNRFLAAWSSKLTSLIRAEDPDWIMVLGYSGIGNWIAVRASRRAHVLYLSDSNGNIPVTALRRAIKSLPVRYFFTKVDRFLTPGEANRRFLRRYGADEARMSWYPFGIDTRRFAPRVDGAERPYDLLWAGKLIERKRAVDYLAALKLLAADGVKFRALLVGDGPLKRDVENHGKDLVARGLLEMRGFVNQKDMPAVLQSAAVFVLSSVDEPYGLAATEAAAAGCALIVADGAGCIGERGSAHPAENAQIYEPANAKDLAAAMKSVIESPSRLGAMQQASRRVAAQHSVDKDAQVIQEIVLSDPMRGAS